MTHDTDNPFAPPGALLTGDAADGPPAASERADPLLRVMATLVGIALALVLLLGSPLTFELVGQFARIESIDGFAARMLPLLLFLALYLPWSALELHRRNQTLPFRMFGLRFCAVDGTRVHGLRIAALWSIPRLLIGLLPFLAALYLDLDSRLGPGLSVSGPLLLLLDAVSAWGVDRRTMLDRFARLQVVKS